MSLNLKNNSQLKNQTSYIPQLSKLDKLPPLTILKQFSMVVLLMRRPCSPQGQPGGGRQGGPCPLLRHHWGRHHNLIAGCPTGGELHPSAPHPQPAMTMTMAMARVVKLRTPLVSQSSRKWVGLDCVRNQALKILTCWVHCHISKTTLKTNLKWSMWAICPAFKVGGHSCPVFKLRGLYRFGDKFRGAKQTFLSF